ncbi:hypothetical protein FRX31_020537 [Thalictrum thalictroides]|uniref:Uncharacterized protein n=1 Tax=Thalictrum thalictroides TaxID=46969 RepID=A0A7J6VYV9_THATH|nr:hypothetical protein FRX31_020537 [Thalictrum thalictroides]
MSRELGKLQLSSNLSKTKIMTVGQLQNLERIAHHMGCVVDSLPARYLGMPLGAKFKFKEKVKAMNRALRGKWLRRYQVEHDSLWKRVISSKYGIGERPYGVSLRQRFPAMYTVSNSRNATVNTLCHYQGNTEEWNLNLRRNLFEREQGQYDELMHLLEGTVNAAEVQDLFLGWANGQYPYERHSEL